MFLITGATKEENVYMNLKNENIQQRNTAHTLMLISYSLPGDWHWDSALCKKRVVDEENVSRVRNAYFDDSGCLLSFSPKS